jgi:hypothetical protein
MDAIFGGSSGPITTVIYARFVPVSLSGQDSCSEMEGEMPRERTPTCTPAGRVVGTDEIVAPPPWDVEVTWTRDGGVVQVATTAADADERLRAWTELDFSAGQPAIAAPDAPPAAVTVASAGAAGTKPGTSFKMFSGWHVDLDRAGVNRLIRVLRTARDQAFGKDE